MKKFNTVKELIQYDALSFAMGEEVNKYHFESSAMFCIKPNSYQIKSLGLPSNTEWFIDGVGYVVRDNNSNTDVNSVIRFMGENSTHSLKSVVERFNLSARLVYRGSTGKLSKIELLANDQQVLEFWDDVDNWSIELNYRNVTSRP